MIYYGKQSIDQDDIDAVADALNSDFLTQGPEVERFENDLKDYFGAKHALVLANGTAALHLAGLALDWQQGDIIITTPLSFLATANCIVYNGAIPDFADIDPVTYTIDPNLVEEKVKSYRLKGKKVKAVIGVDYSGNPCDWKGLRQIADKYEIQLVNDNCHALGTTYFKDKQYAMKYADVVTQSYHPVKHITTGEGGSILTNSLKIDEKVRSLRTHGMIKDQSQLEKNEGPWYYEMHELGYNYRITDIQCALGRNQLKKLDIFVSKRREIAQQYNRILKNIESITAPTQPKNVKSSYHLYPLQINFENFPFSKLEFFEKMKSSGIHLQVHYIPIHIQPFYRKNYGFKIGDFPLTENFYQNEFSFPIYPNLSYQDVSRIIDNILSITN